MYHKPYFDWMNLALDGEIALEQRTQLNTHLADCAECLSLWEALNAAHGLFDTAPSALPRAGFSGRFKARLAQQRSQPRLVWGALALGFSSVGAAILILPIGLSLILSTVRVAQQPATTLALTSGLNALATFANAIFSALLITAQAVVINAVALPLVWGAAASVLLVVVAWAIAVRKLIVGVPVR